MNGDAVKTAREGASSKAQDIACQALERMDALELLPTPENYEIWYKYYDGDAELVGAIDKLGDNIDELACSKLYKRYLTNTAHEEAVRKISDQIQQAITEIASLFKNVKIAADEYGETLGSATQEIEEAESIEDLAQIVNEMVRSTKQIVAYNQTLESELETSSSQMAELRENLDVVRKEALTDGLTGLANRKALDRYLDAAIREAHESKGTITLLMMDIDHFKAFNDTHGHLIGDQVLRLVARSLKDGIKGRDLAARYGGEEFAIVLPETNIEAGMHVGNILRRAVESKKVVNRTSGEDLGQITLSVGVAELFDKEDANSLIRRADEALYAAKQAGRNTVIAYNQD